MTRGRTKSVFVVLLVRPHVRRRDRQADANIIGCDVEHHEILRQGERAMVMLADLTFDVPAGVEVVEEVVDDGKPRLDQSKHLSRFVGRRMHHGPDGACGLFVVARALDQLRHGVEALVDQEVGALGIVDKEPGSAWYRLRTRR